MDLSVITPSLNMLEYLRRCHASVADQAGASVEHIVVDGGSSDGSAEFVRRAPDVVGLVGPDAGMYDAINKGLRLAQGEIVAYLNCDEQYLPGTLSFVKQAFAADPSLDVLAGDTLLIRPDGSLIAYRKAYPLPRMLMLVGPLPVQSSSLFFRRRVFDDGHYFDASLKDLGDYELLARLLRCHYRLRVRRRYLSAFTITGANRGFSPNARREASQMRSRLPGTMLGLRYPLRLARWTIKLLAGAYWQPMPLTYSVYDSSQATTRRVFVVDRASFRWRRA
jgi:glycosyltransferase involved in cell wall biosynthesis